MFWVGVKATATVQLNSGHSLSKFRRLARLVTPLDSHVIGAAKLSGSHNAEKPNAHPPRSFAAFPTLLSELLLYQLFLLPFPGEW